MSAFSLNTALYIKYNYITALTNSSLHLSYVNCPSNVFRFVFTLFLSCIPLTLLLICIYLCFDEYNFFLSSPRIPPKPPNPICIQTLSLRILGCPLGCFGFPAGFGELVFARDGLLKRILTIGRLENGNDRLDDKFGVQSGYPGILDGLRAEFARVCLHLRMVNLRDELHLRRFERVVVWEINEYRKFASNKGRAFGSVQHHVPLCNVVFVRLNCHPRNRCLVQITQLFVNSACLALHFFVFKGSFSLFNSTAILYYIDSFEKGVCVFLSFIWLLDNRFITIFTIGILFMYI